MTKRFSLKRFIRQELESERGELVFLLMIAIPVAIAISVACFHFFYTYKIFSQVNDAISNMGSKISISEPVSRKEDNSKMSDGVSR